MERPKISDVMSKDDLMKYINELEKYITELEEKLVQNWIENKYVVGDEKRHSER